MRVLIFHGYLLRGTGSNVYTANLARALIMLGHEVHVLCQDLEAEKLEFVGAIGTWEDGKLRVRQVRDHGCTVYTPAIGEILPVYVADRYDGFEARPFQALTDAQLDRYVESNVAAVHDVVARAKPDLALANHLVMGPAIVTRALQGLDVPLVVKVHGSALEYTVKPHPRFRPFASEGLATARRVLVGSRHTASSLWAAMDDPSLPGRTVLAPPGVDTALFSPATEASVATQRLRVLAHQVERLSPSTTSSEGSSFHRDTAAVARALQRAAAAAEAGPLILFVGKLLIAKGLDLLALAWPLVLQQVPEAQLAIVGFGAFGTGAEQLTSALEHGDLAAVHGLVRVGRAAEGGEPGELSYASAFLEELSSSGDHVEYLEEARRVRDTIVFTGRLEHDELPSLLAAGEALVVPSTFPEAFGMVGVEAAACGLLPISAVHSGLAEVTRSLAPALPEPARRLLSFPLGSNAVRELADRIIGWLQLDAATRAEARRALVEVARERYSWQSVAERVISAALDADLPALGDDPTAPSVGAATP